MDDYRVASGWATHPKRKKLQRRLGPQAVLSLMDLWGWAAQNRTDGDLSGLSDEDLAIAVDYPGDAKEWVDELVAMRFLEGGIAARIIHDWPIHNPWLAGHKSRSEAGKTAAKKRWENRGVMRGASSGIAIGIKSLSPDPDPNSDPKSISDPVSISDPKSKIGSSNVDHHFDDVGRGSTKGSDSKMSPPPSPSNWKPGQPIRNTQDLEAAAGTWGWQAGNLTPKHAARCHRITQAGPIEPPEIDVALEVVRRKRVAGRDATAFFLGVVENERQRAADERVQPTPSVPQRSAAEAEADRQRVEDEKRLADAIGDMDRMLKEQANAV